MNPSSACRNSVGLGGTIETASKAWGALSQCNNFGCFYGNLFGKTGTAEFSDDLEGTSRVDRVYVEAAAEPTKGLRFSGKNLITGISLSSGR